MRTTLFATLIVLLGCNPSMGSEGVIGGITLDVEPWTAAPGETMVLTLRNGFPERVGYNLCTSALERERAGGWEAVPSDRACTMELRTLGPGEQATYQLELDDDLDAGEYRYRTTVHLMETETRREVTTETFSVER